MTPNQDDSLDPTQKMAVPEFHRNEDFEALYANHVHIEGNVWDLQMIFGQLQIGPSGDPVVQQHTSIAIPWQLAKVFCFQLAMNIIGYEETRGPIRLTDAVLPLVAGLSDTGRKNPRIMSIVTALVQTANPEAFGPASTSSAPVPEGLQPSPVSPAVQA